MTYAIRCFTILAAAATLATPAAGAQRRTQANAGAVSFAVTVTGPDGAPVDAVTVTVTGAAARSATTEGGRIAFEKMPAGDYTIRFDKDGYIPLERQLTARGRASIPVKVTLTPLPPPPAPPQPPPASAPRVVHASPIAADVPSLIEQNYVGKAASKVTPLACATGGEEDIIQLNEPMPKHSHADADEFLYVVAGEGTSRIGSREDHVKAGSFVLVPRKTEHTLAPTSKGPLVVLSMRAGEHCGG